MFSLNSSRYTSFRYFKSLQLFSKTFIEVLIKARKCLMEIAKYNSKTTLYVYTYTALEIKLVLKT